MTARRLLFVILMSLYAGECNLLWAETKMDSLHFLIPAGPGGGWDNTARSVGEALVKSGITDQVSFENLSGGNGGRAIAKLIETADRQQNTLLVNSSPMVIRSLQKIFPHNFRDLVPIASIIADYACFVVRHDSDIKDWGDAVRQYRENPRSLTVAGGSVRGSTDHLIVAKALSLAGADPLEVIYIPYDGGGKAMAGLLSGETRLLSTGLSEAIAMEQAGEVRIVAITASSRLEAYPNYPTLTEMGYPLDFANWRGFFAAKGLQPQRYQAMEAALREVVSTDAFEEIRRRNAWTSFFLGSEKFHQYLVTQEKEMGQMMLELGFMK